MANSTLFKKTILIIEDNEINREILKSILEDQYTILEACNGQEGLNLINENHRNLSLILLDIQMPVMNGFEFLDEFTKNTQFSRIPIIVTTSATEEEERCLLLGASDYVKKPYSPNIILRRVEALIRLSESVSALEETKFDPFSGLYSLNYFNYYVENNIYSLPNKTFGMILFNINNFAYLNSALGNKACEEFISFFGHSLLRKQNDSLSFARIANDRFAVIYNNKDYTYHQVIEIIENAIKDYPNKNFRLKFSVNEALDNSTSIIDTGNKLFKSLETIQRDYLNNVIVTNEVNLDKENHLHLIESNMESSLISGDFKVFWQPKHDTVNRDLTGAESLVRWIHPVFGLISPGEFIPVFEENGFITKLDLYILEKTCEYLANLRDNNLPLIPVSINLSRRDLMMIDDVKTLSEPLEKYHIDKQYIHFEITESTCGDGEVVLNKAKLIQEEGFAIEIDDFGSGYSSLGMISTIPMNYLKLDISFAKNLLTQKDVAKIVIDLAHAMKCKAIAEGVENDEQLNIYKELGCDYIQGFYFSKPLPYNDFVQYYKNLSCKG